MAAPDLRLPSRLQFAARCPVLISRPAKGRRLSWREWLVVYRQTVTRTSDVTLLMQPRTLALRQATTP